MRPIHPDKRAAYDEARKNRSTARRRPVRDDQLGVRLTTDEREAVEAMAMARGLPSGGALLRMIFLEWRAQQLRKAG